MEEKAFTLKMCEDRGGLVEGECDDPSSQRRGASPGSRVGTDREEDDFCLGKVQAMVRSDLLITHGVSEQDTLYLIKREETRETEDFWHKIDRARNGTETSRVEAQAGDFRADAVREEKEPHRNLERLVNACDAAAKTSLSTGERQEAPWQHRMPTKAALTATHKAPDVYICSEGKRGEVTLPRRSKRTHDESITGKKLEGIAAHCCNQSSSLSERALQLLRGTRKNSNRGQEGGTAVTGTQGKSQECEDRLGDREGGALLFAKVGAEFVDPADARGDLHFEDDSSFAVLSMPTKSELESQFRKHHAGDDVELDSAHVSPRDQDGAVEQSSAMPPMQRCSVQLLPTMDTKICGFAVPASPLAALFARAGLKIQEDTAALLKGNDLAAGDHAAVQLPQVIISAAESDEQPILWGTVNQAFHRRDTQGSSVAWLSAVAKSAAQPEVVQKHEHKRDEIEEEDATVLEGRLQRRWQEKRLQKEQQEVHLLRGAEQPETELQETQQPSSTWQDALFPRLGHEKGDCILLPGLPLQQQQQRDSDQQRRQERLQQPAERRGQGPLRDFLWKKSATGKDEGRQDGGKGTDSEGRERLSLNEMDDQRLALRDASPGGGGVSSAIDQKQEEIETFGKKKANGREVERKDERQESAPRDRWSVRTRTIFMKGGKKKEQWLSLAGGKRDLVDASECARAYYGPHCETEGGMKIEEHSHLTSSIKRANYTENPASTGTTSAVSLRRGSTLQGPPATLARGNFFTAVQAGRPTAKVEVAHEKENFFQDGDKGSCVNAHKAGEATASPPYWSKEPWQDECTWIRSLSGGGVAEDCDAQTLITRWQQQQAEEDWLYFKQLERNPSRKEQGGVRTSRTWTTQGRGLVGCTRGEGKMLSLLGSGSTTADAEFDAVRKGNVDIEREVMLQCLQEIGRRFEAPCGGQHRGAKETRVRYRNFFTQKSSATCVTPGCRASLRQRARPRMRLVRQGLQLGGEIRETKTTGVGRGVSGLRFSRVHYLKSTPLYTKHDTYMRRMLRTMPRGGGNRADQLAHRWLDDCSSEATSGDSNTSESKEEEKAWTQNLKKPEALCQTNPGDQQPANPSFVEEERISQSSSGTSRGWVNIEKPDKQEEGGDDEQNFFEKDSSALETGGGNLFYTGEPPVEMPAKRLADAFAESNGAGGAGVATSPSAASNQATASDACLGSSSSGVQSDKGPSNSSSTWKGAWKGSSSSTQQSGGNTDCKLHRRSLQATLKPSGFSEVVKERKMLEAASGTWHGERHFRGAYQDCVLTDRADGYATHEGMEELDEEHSREAPTGGCTKRVRPSVERHSPSSSVSSRSGWETLETETAFAMQQTSPRYDPAQGARLKATETKHAENPPAVLRRGAAGENLSHSQERPEHKGVTGDRDANEAGYCGVAEQCRKGVTADERIDDEEEPVETIRKMQDMSLVCKKPNKSKREDEGGSKFVTAVHSFDPGTPAGSGTSFLSFFGSAPGWSLLKKGWKEQNEKEKVKGEEEDSQGREGRESHKGVCECDCLIASLENGTASTVEDNSEQLRGLIHSGRANVTKHGKRFSTVCRGVPARKSSNSGTDVRSSTNNYGTRRGCVRRRVIGCCDSRGTDRGRSSRRTSPRLRDSRSRAQGSSGGSIEWRERGSTGRHRSSSSKSISTSILRMSSSDSEGGDTVAFSERSKGVYVASSDGAAEGAGSAREPPLKMFVHAGGEMRQRRSTSAHALLGSSYAPCRKRLPCRTGGGATGARRRSGRVAVDKLGKNLYICDTRCRRNRILLKQLEKEDLMYTKWRQSTGQLLRGAKHESFRGGAAAARTHVNNDLWHSGGLQTAPLNSSTCTPVRGKNGSRTNCDSSSNDLQARFGERPTWTLLRQSAAAGGGVTFQSGSRISSAFPSVYPFPPAAAHFFSGTPFSSAVGTNALISSGPLPVPPAAAPLYANDAASGNILSPVYVSGAAAGCFSRLLRSAPAASSLPAAAAAQAAATASRSQAVSAVAEEVFGNALLPTSSCHTVTSTTHRHIERDGGCAAAAATTPPFWCRWPAAVLRVVGLPLRAVVHLLGLNVNGAYDRWRGEIRRRSLRGFLTLCLLDGVVCAAAVWSIWHLAVFATRGAFKTAYLHVHNIDAERTSHYFDGLTYRFWGKRPLYFTDNPLLGAGRVADAEIATDPWNGLQQLQQRGIAWYQHRMYGDL